MPPPPSSTARKTALGLLTAGLLLGAWELVLRGLDPRGPPAPASARIVRCHLQPTDGGDAPMVAMVCPDEGERWRVTARSARPRVVVVGGSTVHNSFKPEAFPDYPEALAALLPDAEVLNAGKPGADAASVAALVHDLRQLHPDVVVVTTGHNDFAIPVMAGGALVHAEQAVWQADTVLHRLHIYRNLAARLAPPARLAYRASVDGTAPPPALLAACRAAGSPLRETNLMTIAPPPGRLQEALDRLADGLGAAVDAAGAPVVLTTLPRNFDQPPTATTALDPRGCTGLSACPLARLDAEAQAAVGDWLETTCGPDSALGSWARAQVADTAGRSDAAQQAWARSLQTDPLTLRAPLSADAVIRRVATERGARLVDLAPALGDRPDGALFLDQLHLSRAGAQAVADAVAPAVRDALAGTRAPD